MSKYCGKSRSTDSILCLSKAKRVVESKKKKTDICAAVSVQSWPHIMLMIWKRLNFNHSSLKSNKHTENSKHEPFFKNHQEVVGVNDLSQVFSPVSAFYVVASYVYTGFSPQRHFYKEKSQVCFENVRSRKYKYSSSSLRSKRMNEWMKLEALKKLLECSSKVFVLPRSPLLPLQPGSDSLSLLPRCSTKAKASRETSKKEKNKSFLCREVLFFVLLLRNHCSVSP